MLQVDNHARRIHLPDMPKYRFSLLFALAPGESGEPHLDALYEAGCSDASFGLAVRGMLGAEFTRQAPTAADAVDSACRDVLKAVPHALLGTVEPWLGGFAEMASALGCTRQNVARHAKAGGREAFPLPMHMGSLGLWRLGEALGWFARNTSLRPDAAVLEMSMEADRRMDALTRARTAPTMREVAAEVADFCGLGRDDVLEQALADMLVPLYAGLASGRREFLAASPGQAATPGEGEEGRMGRVRLRVAALAALLEREAGDVHPGLLAPEADRTAWPVRNSLVSLLGFLHRRLRMAPPYCNEGTLPSERMREWAGWWSGDGMEGHPEQDRGGGRPCRV